jgi:hypothetical protein
VCACVHVKATHAEDDLTVESRAAVLCGNTRRHLGLSILLPTLRPRPLQPPPILHRCSFTLSSSRAILFLFCTLPSLCVRSTPRARALSSSAFVPPDFLSSRKLAYARMSIVNVFFCAIFVKFLSELKILRAFGIQQ